MFNLDPQLIQDVVITAVNIFILFLAGSYLMFNPVRNFLNKRKEGIAGDIEKAKTDMQDAQAMKAEYEAKLKEVDKEVEAILADARKRALAREEQIIEEAKTEAAHIIERAHNEVLLEKKGAADDMKKEMVALASALAGRWYLLQLTQTFRRHWLTRRFVKWVMIHGKISSISVRTGSL